MYLSLILLHEKDEKSVVEPVRNTGKALNGICDHCWLFKIILRQTSQGSHMHFLSQSLNLFVVNIYLYQVVEKVKKKQVFKNFHFPTLKYDNKLHRKFVV